MSRVVIIRDLAKGDVLSGRYVIESSLGHGGMGSVYRAFDQQNGGTCAVKVLHAATSGDAGIVRFKREFRAASRLMHPNCVRVFDLGSDDNRWYYTMEFVAGGSLDGWEGKRPEEVIALSLQMLAALDHIHAKQIVHRDIKPQNVLLDRTGAGLPLVKLTDFGIVKVAGLEEEIGVGSLAGSLPYLSPEQGEESPVDPRSDLYSLGVVIYEMLSGRRPIEPGKGNRRSSGKWAWVAEHRNTPPAPLSDVAPGVPPEVARVVMRLLAKDPAQRPSTAAAVYDELAAWLKRAAPTLAPRPPPLSRNRYLAAPRLVGRDAEVEQLRQFLDARLEGRTGAPMLLLVSGEAGVGKSRLVNQLRALTEERGAIYLPGICRQEGGLSFEPVISLIRMAESYADVPTPLTETMTESSEPSSPTVSSDPALLDTAVALQATAAAPAAAAMRPGYATVASDNGHSNAPPTNRVTGAGDLFSAEEREGMHWRFQRRIADGVIAVARKTRCVVVVEDAHWADTPTLQLLGFLLRSLSVAEKNGEPVKVAFIVTHRPAPDHHALAELSQLARSHGASARIELQPLDLAAATALVSSMTMVPVDEKLERFTARLLSQANGNPLYLGQILHTLLASGKLQRDDQGWDLDEQVLAHAQLPSTIRDAIGDRAARFGGLTNQAMAAAAVIGRRFDLSTLQAAIALEQTALLDSLDEAIRAGFVIEDEQEPGYYLFVHDRFRDAIHERLPRADAMTLHGKVARHLAQRYGDAPERAADLAHHYAEAGELKSAYRHSARAGDHAMRTYAFTRAADLYAQAIDLGRSAELPIPPELIERQGDACLQGGRYAVAAQCFANVLTGMREPLERAEILRKAAEVEFRRGKFKEATELMEKVLVAVHFPVPRSRVALLLRLLWNGIVFLLYLLMPSLLVRKNPARRSPSRELVASVCIRLGEAFYSMDFLRAAYYALASINVAERIGPSKELSLACAQQGFVLTSFGFYRLGWKYAERARRDGEAYGSPVELAWEACVRGLSWACRGEAKKDTKEQKRAEALLARSLEPLRLRQVWTILGEAQSHLGNVGTTEKLGLQLERLAEDLNDDRGRGWAAFLLGQVAARRGKYPEAVAKLTRAVELSLRAGDVAYELGAGGRLTITLALTGQLDEAVRVGLHTTEKLAAKKLRHPYIIADGAFLVAAALKKRRDGKLPAELERAVSRVRRRTGVHKTLQITRPLFLAGCAAMDVANGQLEEARAMFTRALGAAEKYELAGDLQEIHELALQVYPDGAPDRERHLSALALLNRMLSYASDGLAAVSATSQP